MYPYNCRFTNHRDPSSFARNKSEQSPLYTTTSRQTYENCQIQSAQRKNRKRLLRTGADTTLKKSIVILVLHIHDIPKPLFPRVWKRGRNPILRKSAFELQALLIPAAELLRPESVFIGKKCEMVCERMQMLREPLVFLSTAWKGRGGVAEGMLESETARCQVG